MTRETARQVPAAEFPDSDSVLAQLDRILSSQLFRHSKRYPAFLRHVVEQTVRGAGEELKERTVGVEVFKRSPDYDTGADPVVRNTASEVRKRLDEYYSEPGRERDIRISLPVGGYAVEFRYPAGSATNLSDPPQAAATPQIPVRRWLTLGVALLGLAGLGLLGAIELVPRKSPIDLFWAPVLQTPYPVLVVTDTLVALREKPDSGGPSGSVREIIDPKVFLNVNEQSAKLASFLIAHGKQLDYELARNASLATLRQRPFILKGAFNNQWTRRAVAPFRFYFQLDEQDMVRRIVDRQNPARRDWAAPMVSGLTQDFALIARASEPETGQTMLVIAGLSEKGSAAALEFVTNPRYFDLFAAQAPAGWAAKNIELVIKSDLVNDDWGEPRVIATHFW